MSSLCSYAALIFVFLIMILYSNGCSISIGSELFTEDYPQYSKKKTLATVPAARLREDGLYKLADINEQRSYPGLIAKEIGASLLSRGINGSGNEVIAYGVISDLQALLSKHPASEILAIVGWSSICRRFLVKDYGFTGLCPPNIQANFPLEKTYGELINTFWLEEALLGLVKYFNAIALVENFCKQHQIRLLMFDGVFDTWRSKEELQEFNTALASQTFFKEHEPSEAFFFHSPLERPTTLVEYVHQHRINDFNTYVDQKELPRCQYKHPGSVAHKAWSEVLLNALYARNLL